MSNNRLFRSVKTEIRILGVDDGKFTPHTRGEVMIVGVVFRGGYWIDGVMHTKIEIDGLDATDKISDMVNNSPHHKQIRMIMLNGITFGGFNIINLRQLNEATDLPVVALTRNKPDLTAIGKALEHLTQSKKRWRMVLEAEALQEITCKGSKLFIGLAGVEFVDAKKIIELTSTRSCIPEPLRIAHLIASGVTS